jgi:hypothetical protein
MVMSFTYDDSDFAEITTELAVVRPGAVYAKAAPEIERLITEQFWAGTDPFGNPWAPLVLTGEQSHLIDKGVLLPSVKITGTPDGLDFEMESYGVYHQYGTMKMVARPILPLGGEYPESWDGAIADAVLALAPSLERG